MHDKTLAWLFWSLGILGVGGLHRFYLGKPLSGLFYLCTFNLMGLGFVLDAFNMNRLIDEADTEWRVRHALLGDGRASLPALPAPPTSLMHLLLKAAEGREGVLTLSEAVLDTGRDYAEVEEELTALMRRGVVTVENHPETGVVLYRFVELGKRA